MLNTKAFGNALLDKGINFFSGVPCSFLKHLINYANNETHYVMSPNEGDAVATCAGAYLGGKTPAVLLQNSGLGNAVSPLTSLTHPFQIPILGFVSLRGEPGIKDEPQHTLMGQITTTLLETMDIEWAYLSDDNTAALQQVDLAMASLKSHKSFFFVVKKNTFSEHPLIKRSNTAYHNKPLPNLADIPTSTTFPIRHDALNTILDHRDSQTVIFASTGYTGRELYSIQDSPSHFYQIGSMGCISALALGFAQAQPKKKAIILDGDGAMLMRLGNVPTLGYYMPSNVCHILLDNAHHESTGSQSTISPNVDFARLADASGYPHVHNSLSTQTLNAILKQWTSNPSLTFIRQFTQIGIPNALPRPTLPPQKQARRFKEFTLDQSE